LIEWIVVCAAIDDTIIFFPLVSISVTTDFLFILIMEIVRDEKKGLSEEI
jgi:hypothetical protein